MARPSLPCRFYLSLNGCKNGSACRFSHTSQQFSTGRQEQMMTQTRQSFGSPTKLCRYFNSPRGCQNTRDCPFIHSREWKPAVRSPPATATISTATRQAEMRTGQENQPAIVDEAERLKLILEKKATMALIKCGVCHGDFVSLPGDDRDICDVLRDHYEQMFYVKHDAHTQYFNQRIFRELGKGQIMTCMVEGCAKTSATVPDLLQHLGHNGKWLDKPVQGREELKSEHQSRLANLAWHFAWRDVENTICGRLPMSDQEALSNFDKELIELLRQEEEKAQGIAQRDSEDRVAEKPAVTKPGRAMSAEENEWLRARCGFGQQWLSTSQIKTLTRNQVQKQIEITQKRRSEPIPYDSQQIKSAVHSTKRYLCLVCKEVKIGLAGIKNHMKDKHPDEVDEYFKCHICELDCGTVAFLYHHFQEKHQVVVSERSIRLFLCISDVSKKCSIYRKAKDWVDTEPNILGESTKTGPQTKGPGLRTDQKASEGSSSAYQMDEIIRGELKRKITDGERSAEASNKLRRQDDISCRVKDCTSSFNTVEELRNHMKAAHVGALPDRDGFYFCNLCVKQCNSLSSVCLHSVAKHKRSLNYTYRDPASGRSEINVQFMLPKKRFYKGALEEFEEFIRNPESQPTENRNLTLTELFAKLMDKHEPTPEHNFENVTKDGTEFPCAVEGCGRRFPGLLGLQNHMENVHAVPNPSKKNRYKCSSCSKRCESLVSMCMHSKVKHKSKVNYTYVDDATLTNIHFAMPARGWSKHVIADFEHMILNPEENMPAEYRNLPLSTVLARLIAQRAEKSDEIAQIESDPSLLGDAEVFRDYSAEEAQPARLARIRSNRLKSLLQKSGFSYDVVEKKKVRGTLVCPVPICCRVVHSLISLRNHCQKLHGNLMRRARVFKCYECGMETYSSHVLCLHLNERHELKIPLNLVNRFMGVTNFEAMKKAQAEDMTAPGADDEPVEEFEDSDADDDD